MNEDSRIVNDPVTGPLVLESASIPVFSEELEALELELFALEHHVAPNASVAAVILAGGVGSRFGHDGGKQLVEVAGLPVLTWAAAAFDAVAQVGLIVVVCPEDRIEEYQAHAFDPYPFLTPITFAPSGFIRQESAINGINAVPESYEFIAIHDGARPVVSPQLITHAINELKGSIDLDGVVVGHPAIDTLKVVNESGLIVGTPDRSRFWNAQTPQIFRAEATRDAYQAAMEQGFVGTDDSSVLEHAGARIRLIESMRDNIKVTVPEDLALVEAALRRRHKTDLQQEK